MRNNRSSAPNFQFRSLTAGLIGLVLVGVSALAIVLLTGPQTGKGAHELASGQVGAHWPVLDTRLWCGELDLALLVIAIAIVIWSQIEAARCRRRFAQDLAQIVDNVPHMVWSSSSDGRMHYNKRWEEFTGVVRTHDGDADELVHPEDRERAVAEWDLRLAAGEPFEIEYRLRHHSGEHRWVCNKGAPEFQEGKLVGWYGTCTDIHERVLAGQALRESLGQLKWSSEHDPLTSLVNRRGFQHALEAAHRSVKPGEQVGLLLIDLDHFKHVNDSYGHAVGDELLQILGQRLAAGIRETDVAGRLGGDEFAVLLRDIRSAEEAVAVAVKLCSSLTGPMRLRDRVLNSGASIGVATFPKHAVSPDELFRSADAALYELKRSGRGGVRLFEDYMLTRIANAAHQLSRARRAAMLERIVPVYQPKVELKSGSIIGHEALLRWSLPGQPLQSPEMIEEAFEDYELATRIGEMMQRSVARDVRRLREAHVNCGRVSINAAPCEFLRDDYAERLLGVLAEEGVDPSSFEVEITERALIDRAPDFVARALRLLRDAGITISLDDFGTGYSSLSHLRDFSVDLVKIDKSFVRQICDEADIAAIVSAVIYLTQSLGIAVVAEGVETEQQAELLRTMGCGFAQGHLFGHPVPSDAIAAEGLRFQAA